MIEVVNAKDWIKADYVPVASLILSYTEISKRLNINFNDGFEEGLGKSKWQTLKLTSGCQFVVEIILDSLDKTSTILCLNNKKTIESCLNDIFELLKIDMNDVSWIREDIILYSESNILSKNSEPPSRLVMYVLTPFAWLIVYFTYLNNSTRTLNYHLDPLVLIFGVMAMGISVTAIFPNRGWWGIRLVTFTIFIGYLSYFVNQFIINPVPVEIVGRENVSPFNAFLGMLIFGFPSLLYTFWGSTFGRLGHVNQLNVTKFDIFVIYLVWFISIISYALLIISIVILLWRLIS